jgi:ABC-type antimicrobial peptide transport system permease subunit
MQIERQLSEEHLLAELSSMFGLLVLMLACIGLYGTLTYAVSTRHNEIGVRQALGATRGSIARMFLRQALGLVGAGGVAGIVGGLISTRLIGAMLYGLSPTDPTTIASAAALLAAIAALAALVPAYRASRVDPMTVLRRE